MRQPGQWKRWRREAGHGGSVPRGWRMAWYEPRRRVGVYYPAPLHWILGTLRELRYRARLALYAPPVACAQFFEMQRTHRERQQMADEYARGYLAGWRECFYACLEAVQQELWGDDAVWDLGELAPDAKNPRRKN